MSYRDNEDEDPYAGLSDWCTCNCRQEAHYYKHSPMSYSAYGWSPEEVDYGCKDCGDCPNEDNLRCEGCGVWKEKDQIFFVESAKSFYCGECAEEEKGK